MFVSSPLELKTDEELVILYFSLEVSAIQKLSKFISRKLFLETGEIYDTNFILSRGRNRISQPIYDKVVSYRDYFESISDNLLIYDNPINPTGIRNLIIDVFKQRGLGSISTDQHNRMIVEHTELGKKTYFLVILDHIGLMSRESGYSKKENIDKMSEYFIMLRNKLKISPIIISQFNRSIASTDRHKLHMVVPQLSDFSDSASTQQDANIVLALFHPHRYGIKNLTVNGSEFNVEKTTRGLWLLKNRDGADSAQILMDFNGAVSYFKQI